jgi:hypothetical protein
MSCASCRAGATGLLQIRSDGITVGPAIEEGAVGAPALH